MTEHALTWTARMVNAFVENHSAATRATQTENLDAVSTEQLFRRARERYKSRWKDLVARRDQTTRSRNTTPQLSQGIV